MIESIIKSQLSASLKKVSSKLKTPLSEAVILIQAKGENDIEVYIGSKQGLFKQRVSVSEIL